jgi:hypothetical protein
MAAGAFRALLLGAGRAAGSPHRWPIEPRVGAAKTDNGLKRALDSFARSYVVVLLFV